MQLNPFFQMIIRYDVIESFEKRGTLHRCIITAGLVCAIISLWSASMRKCLTNQSGLIKCTKMTSMGLYFICFFVMLCVCLWMYFFFILNSY